MVFSSFHFLFLFFPLLLIVYFFPLFRKRSIRNGILLVFSLIFYSFGGWRMMPIILLSIAMNYVFGRLADAEHAQRVRKAAVVASVVCNLLLLFVFQVSRFHHRNASPVVSWNSSGGTRASYWDLFLYVPKPELHH